MIILSFQAAPGLVPVIINIQPLQNLPLFLGINEATLSALTKFANLPNIQILDL